MSSPRHDQFAAACKTDLQNCLRLGFAGGLSSMSPAIHLLPKSTGLSLPRGQKHHAHEPSLRLLLISMHHRYSKCGILAVVAIGRRFIRSRPIPATHSAQPDFWIPFFALCQLPRV